MYSLNLSLVLAIFNRCVAGWVSILRAIGFSRVSLELPAVECHAREHNYPTRLLGENGCFSVPPALLHIGNTSETWLFEGVVRRTYCVDSDAGITKENMTAAENEANVYLILGKHPLIAECLAIGPSNECIDLRYYPKGSLRDYVSSHRSVLSVNQLNAWARQLVESVEYVHRKGVRHSDLRLDQWLLDDDMCPRLADFHGSGFDGEPALGLAYTPATKFESASHCQPRDFEQDNTVTSDLFALGSSLYELMTDYPPYEGEEDDAIERKFASHIFPIVEHIPLGRVILGCWQGRYCSASDVLADLPGPKPSSID